MLWNEPGMWSSHAFILILWLSKLNEERRALVVERNSFLPSEVDFSWPSFLKVSKNNQMWHIWDFTWLMSVLCLDTNSGVRPSHVSPYLPLPSWALQPGDNGENIFTFKVPQGPRNSPGALFGLHFLMFEGYPFGAYNNYIYNTEIA